jgi:hypothetical protein
MKGEVKYLSYMFVENALTFLGILHPKVVKIVILTRHGKLHTNSDRKNGS